MPEKHVFIIGSKGIPAQYGGFETFVEKLTAYKKNQNIKYHVACLSDHNEEFIYNGAECFKVKVPEIGAAKAVLYDITAIKYCCKYIAEKKIKNAVVYVLACRIGPFIGRYKKTLHSLGAKLYVNPDGHEWKRAKWSMPVRKYWRISERLMVKHSDLLICDSKNIEKYIKETYGRYNPKTVFIAYGSDTKQSVLSDNDTKLTGWYEDKGLESHNYYLIVGRFVPENNYETIIREFMASQTKKTLAIVTDVTKNKFYDTLKKSTAFDRDPRIKFVGTAYDGELLKKIRENAYGYIHGHEVGGTNPSLLEALASTKINLLLDVGFNREVGQDGALYWTKKQGSLSKLIDKADHLNSDIADELCNAARSRINNCYNWNYIVKKYEEVL